MAVTFFEKVLHHASLEAGSTTVVASLRQPFFTTKRGAS